ERYVNRRQFTKFLTLTSFAMFAGNLWVLARSIFYRPPAFHPQAIASLDELPVGGVKTFAFPEAGDPCILIRTGADEWVAYSQKCPHPPAAVYHEREQNRLGRPCHRGFSSIVDGAVLQGPPQRPLPRVALARENGQLIALRMEGESV